MKKIIALLLVCLLILPVLVSCDGSNEPAETKKPSDTSGNETEPVETEDDPFADFDYKGETFHTYTSSNQATISMSTSNYYIQGSDELTGDAALDAAIKRNQDVSDRLNVNLMFTPISLNHEEVASTIRQLLLSGDTTYQLIINDIWGLVPITPEGLFRNSMDGENFDFSQPWWYDAFMDDIALNTNLRFALAGDFFIDQLRCTHCLIMNKDIYRDIYGDPDDVYQMVLDKKWTIDAFTKLMDKAYYDLNGNTLVDSEDQFGFIAFSLWGSIIPWIISADPGFIERDEEGYPTITVNNEKSYTLVEKLNVLFHHKAAGVELFEDDEQSHINMFSSGQALFIFYQRLASLENSSFRNASVDLAVLPYPLLDETQADYVTSTHDTAELGFIPYTVSDKNMPFVSAVIEVLCRETNKQVLPTYYESSLKIKYTRDRTSAQMIDIIHDHYGNGFALAWSAALDGVFLSNTFRDCVFAGLNNFASEYKSVGRTAERKLKNFIQKSEDLLLKN